MSVPAQTKADIVLLGYPKTGNTWLRLLLGRYVQVVASLPELLLLDGSVQENEICRAKGLPLFETTHGPLLWDDQDSDALTYANTVAPYLSAKVVLIVRHPLDAIVSHYMHHRFQAGHEERKDFATVEHFADDPVFGLAKFYKFHQLWAPEIAAGRAMIMRYEDMKADPAGAARRLLAYLGMPLNEAALADAIGYSSFDNMRKMEEGEAPRYKGSGFRIFATGEMDEPRARHVREGKVGGYRGQFSSEACARLEKQINSELPAIYGYSTQ